MGSSAVPSTAPGDRPTEVTEGTEVTGHAPGTGSRFLAAAEQVLQHLRTTHPMTVWSVSRVEDGTQTHLHLGPNDFGLQQGARVAWEDSLCTHMVAGHAPRVSPDTSQEPAYRDSPATAALGIQAYAGVPIEEPDGSLYGVLCGLDRQVQTDLAEVGPLLELLRGLLAHVLAGERALEEATRRTGSAMVDAETDAMTGLLNRRGWDRAVTEAQHRLAALGDPSVVVVADLDGLKQINDEHGHSAGDRYLVTAAETLRAAVRPHDAVARLGGDEFGILLNGFPGTHAAGKVAGLAGTLDAAGVSASFGFSAVRVGGDFMTALALADAAMYADKRSRRSAVRD